MGRTQQIAKEISVIVPTYIRNIHAAVLKKIDMPPSQMITLVTIYQCRDCRICELSKMLKVSAPTMTGLVDRLEKSGHIQRVPDKKDRRVTHIVTTKKGKQLALEFQESIRDQWEKMLSKIPLCDQEHWLRIFKKITENLENENT